LKAKLLRRADAFLPVVAIATVLSVCGWLVGGTSAVALTALLVTTLVLVAPRLSPGLVMRLSGAYPAPKTHMWRHYVMLARLARAAGLAATPTLYLAHVPTPTVFSVGNSRASAIALSDGFLAVLDERETCAVLGHEIAHIAANDTALMRAADILGRVTSFVATIGLFSVIASIFLTARSIAPFWALWFLALAPIAVMLLQLGLSRRREFAADREAARLTGDPAALAGALVKIETATRWSMQRMFGDFFGLRMPSLLRTHPSTRERIGRLLGTS